MPHLTGESVLDRPVDATAEADTIAEINVRAMKSAEQNGARPTLSDRGSDLITRFAGSMTFVWLHVAWFVAWIALNVLLPEPFDAFPFGFLTMVVSLEAIFLSTFVLVSQNRQAMVADRRAQLDMQVNLIAEQEVTKVMEMVADLHEHFGLDGHKDPEVQEMIAPTELDTIARSLDGAEDPRPDEDDEADDTNATDDAGAGAAGRSAATG